MADKVKNLSLFDLLDKYCEQESIHRFEGEGGVRNLCRIARAIGYKDEMHFGQFSGGCYGDLIQFLEDNPGCVQTIYNWIVGSLPQYDRCGKDPQEWKDSVAEQLDELPESEEEDDEDEDA